MTDTIEEPTQYMLTTVDNPFDPFIQFDEWYQWDVSAGYNTAALLARITKSSSELSEPDQALAIQQAIDEIVEENVTGMFRKVSQSSG
jgi:hypothetical protein